MKKYCLNIPINLIEENNIYKEYVKNHAFYEFNESLYRRNDIKMLKLLQKVDSELNILSFSIGEEELINPNRPNNLEYYFRDSIWWSKEEKGGIVVLVASPMYMIEARNSEFNKLFEYVGL